MKPEKPVAFAAVPEVDYIRSKMARMWLISALGKSGAQVIQLVSLAVLARLLVPSDFGMVAMVMAVIGVAGIFSDMGLSAATVRAKSLTEAQASSLLMLNIGFGLVTSIALYAAAPLLMRIYDNPDLVLLAQLMSWSFLIGSLGTQHLALLRRQLKFALLAKLNLVSVAVGQLVAIVLAVQGHGYWSIAVGMLVSGATRTAGAWLLNRWRPGPPEFSASLRSMLGFGGYLVVFSLLGYAATQAHNVFIGAEHGARDVGYYSRAFGLVTLLLGYVTGPMDIVAPAALSRLLGDATSYEQSYINMLALMLLLTAPLGFLCALTAPDVVLLLLGDQWHGAILILQILALAAIPQTLCNSSGWLYQSHGDSRNMMLWGIGGWGTLILLLYWGTSQGIQGVAIAYTGGMLLLVFPCLKLAFRRVNIPLWRALKPCIPIIAASMIGIVPTYFINAWLVEWGAAFRLLLSILSYGAVYLALLLAFGQRALLESLVNQVRART